MSRGSRSAAVLLLAYGSPDSPADVPAYLFDIRGGRKTPDHVVEDVRRRYERIGGRSPLLGITQRVAEKLGERLALPAYVGMRHWCPYVKDVVAQMAADGVRHLVAICMAPHYSRLSIGAYRQKLDDALAAVDETIGVAFVESWGTQPEYLAGVAANVRETLARFPSQLRDQAKVVFTAHSLPAFILERGDPYDRQLRETARLLVQQLQLPSDRWTFCYQSAAASDVSWLGPQIEDLVPELAAQGERNLVIAPIGFIADHVEVLYDLDIGVQEIAKQSGVRVERTPMLNDGEPLIAALASLVQERLPVPAAPYPATEVAG